MLNLANEDFREGDTVYFVASNNQAKESRSCWTARLFEGKVTYLTDPTVPPWNRLVVDFTMPNGHRKVEQVSIHRLTKDKAWARARRKLEIEKRQAESNDVHILFETQTTIVLSNAPFNDCCLDI